MFVVFVLSCGVLMLCWSRLCVASHGPAGTARTPAAPHGAPCYMDDMFAALREGLGNNGELTRNSYTLFGVCTLADNSSGSVLLRLARETSGKQRHGLEGLHPTGVSVGVEEDDGGTLTLTFDLPPSPLLSPSPVLLLAFDTPVKGEDLDVIFSSPSLHPNTQTACLTAETQYALLTGRASEGQAGQRWRISVETTSPDMKQNLKDVIAGPKTGSNINTTPLLLFSGGTETRHASAPSRTFSFLCELRRFLSGVLPLGRPESPRLQLDSLLSLPPLALGLASSQSLLAGLINSSSPTVFSFTRWASVLQVHPGQLSLSPALLQELRRRLGQTVAQVMEVFREEEGEVGDRARGRLGRLRGLSALPEEESAAGESQYRAFLLLKALQTVARAYELRVNLRTTRAGPNDPVRRDVCGLSSLTVSLEKYLVGPNTAVINNCRGSCSFPLFNANNHAVLLNSHIESKRVEERAPCCVPVVYDALEVVDLNEHGTYLSVKPEVVAKECGCR